MSEPTDLPGAAPLPEPVTFDRLTAQLDAAELNLTPSGENKLRGRWQENIIEFVLNTAKTSIMQLQGLSAVQVAAEREVAVATFANDWHRDRIWPTVLWTPTSRGTLALRTIYAADVTGGATAEQLQDIVRLGLSATAKCLSSLEETFTTSADQPQ